MQNCLFEAEFWRSLSSISIIWDNVIGKSISWCWDMRSELASVNFGPLPETGMFVADFISLSTECFVVHRPHVSLSAHQGSDESKTRNNAFPFVSSTGQKISLYFSKFPSRQPTTSCRANSTRCLFLPRAEIPRAINSNYHISYERTVGNLVFSLFIYVNIRTWQARYHRQKIADIKFAQRSKGRKVNFVTFAILTR